MAETVTRLALRQLLDSSPSCTVDMGVLWNRHLFVDPCWPGEGQRGEVLQTSRALAEVGKGKALKAEMVLKGQMMTDS